MGVATLAHRKVVSAGFHVLQGEPSGGGSGRGVTLVRLGSIAREHDVGLLDSLARDGVDDTALDRTALLLRRPLAFRHRALLCAQHSGREEQRSYPEVPHSALSLFR